MINPLPGVPLIDSPFFERLFPLTEPDAGTTRMAEDLRRDGFAVFDFPDAEIDRLCGEIIAALSPSEQEFAAWRTSKAGLRRQDAWETNQNVRRIAANAVLLERLRKLYGREAFPFQTLNFPAGSEQDAHSDATHFSSVPSGFMCGVWLALEDIDADNGPLIYYPGSHRWPFYGNEHIGVNVWHQPTRTAAMPAYQKLWNELITLNGAEPKRFLAKKGQAAIWHAYLLHGGDRHRDLARTRWSQVTHYYFKDCAYYTPSYSDPFYGNIFFRDIVDASTGERVPNSVCGRRVPRWFLSQAKYHGPLNALREEAAALKRKLLGRSRP